MRMFSIKDRPVHLGPFPLERLARRDGAPDLSALTEPLPLSFHHSDPENLINAMARFMGMFDTVRDGALSHGPADIPESPEARSAHLKAASYYFDASMVGIAALVPDQLPARGDDAQHDGGGAQRCPALQLLSGVTALQSEPVV